MQTKANSNWPLYPGRPILTNCRMSTLGRSGAGCAGASWASLAALRALPTKQGTMSQWMFSQWDYFLNISLTSARQERNQGTKNVQPVRLLLNSSLTSARQETNQGTKNVQPVRLPTKKGTRVNVQCMRLLFGHLSDLCPSPKEPRHSVCSASETVLLGLLSDSEPAHQETNQRTVTNERGSIPWAALCILPLKKEIKAHWRTSETVFLQLLSELYLGTGLVSFLIFFFVLSHQRSDFTL